MAKIITTDEWIVAGRLMEKTGLNKRQLKSYRLGSWIEGIHFKRVPQSPSADKKNAMTWYNYTRIHQYIQEA